jgi:hypothetical protein
LIRATPPSYTARNGVHALDTIRTDVPSRASFPRGILLHYQFPSDKPGLLQ